LCLTLHGISLEVSIILEEVLLFTSLSPLWVYGLAEYLALIFMLMVFKYVIRTVKKIDFDQAQSIKRIFLTTIMAYILTQVLGFVTPLISSLYQDIEYFALKKTYHNDLKDHYALKTFIIETPIWILNLNSM
tara:strand:- start:13661 stop:14056 length:396 start_codon:yes stop_codon:yes gene_type:complete